MTTVINASMYWGLLRETRREYFPVGSRLHPCSQWSRHSSPQSLPGDNV